MCWRTSGTNAAGMLLLLSKCMQRSSFKETPNILRLQCDGVLANGVDSAVLTVRFSALQTHTHTHTHTHTLHTPSQYPSKASPSGANHRERSGDSGASIFWKRCFFPLEWYRLWCAKNSRSRRRSTLLFTFLQDKGSNNEYVWVCVR